jgi:predicted nuclease of predicted toxin-antitoxin system
VRLLLDEHYSPTIAAKLREAGFDAVTVDDAGLSGASDGLLYEFALMHRRAVVTNNARDFLRVIAEGAASGDTHFGLLLTSDVSMPRSQRTIGRYVRALEKILRANPEEDALANQVRWLR